MAAEQSGNRRKETAGCIPAMGMCATVPPRVENHGGFSSQHYSPEDAVRSILSGDEVVTFGTCINPCTKDQDRLDYRKIKQSENSSIYCFALFDGHGIASTVSDIGERDMLQLVESEYLEMFSQAGETKSEGKAEGSEVGNSGGGDEEYAQILQRAFSKVSESIMRTVGAQRVGSTATILMLHKLGGGSWSLSCAWVGDSRAAIVLPTGKGENINEDHRLELEREKERVMEVHASEAKEAAQGQRLTVVANRVCNATGQVGPRVVFNEKTGVSLMVTRALGDPLGASAIISEPDINARAAPATSRLVVASDGIWDVLNEQQVAGLLRRSKDPRKAAQIICEVAKRRRLYGGFSPDDCSAIVINLDENFYPT